MNIVPNVDSTKQGEVSMSAESLLNILNNGTVLIQLSSYVFASRLLSLAQQGYQFTIITANPALRRVFESSGIVVIFIDVQEPRLRELLNPMVVRRFRKRNKILSLDLKLDRFTSVILTINSVDIPILEIITQSPRRSCQFYFLPEFPSSDVQKCNAYSASKDEILQILKRKILYQIQSYLGKSLGGRHAYVDLEREIPDIRYVAFPAKINEVTSSNRHPRCIFLASYSYDEDEDYFGNTSFANALRVVTKLTRFEYKIHPGFSFLTSSEFDDLGMIPILNENPIENLVVSGDLVIGNDSTAFPRLSFKGAVVVSISHMIDLVQRPQKYGIDRRRLLEQLQDECDGAILVPKNFDELESIVLSWKTNSLPLKFQLQTE